MRIVLLLVVVIATWAQEVEVFRLKDGRELIGTYDEATGVLLAKVGGASARIEVKPGDIISRRTAPPPEMKTDSPIRPPPAVAVAPNPQPEPPQRRRPAPPSPPELPQVAPEVIAAEEELVREIGKLTLEKDGLTPLEKLKTVSGAVFNELNPMTTAMLLARRTVDPAVRYRCFVELRTDRGDLDYLNNTHWILSAFDQQFKIFAVFVVLRDSIDGRAIERELNKKDFVALHAWVRLRPGRFTDVLNVDKVISAGNWLFPETP